MGLSVKLLKKVNGFTLDVEWAIGNDLAVLFELTRHAEIDRHIRGASLHID